MTIQIEIQAGALCKTFPRSGNPTHVGDFGCLHPIPVLTIDLVTLRRLTVCQRHRSIPEVPVNRGEAENSHSTGNHLAGLIAVAMSRMERFSSPPQIHCIKAHIFETRFAQ